MAQTPVKPREKAAPAPEAVDSEEFAAEVGKLVRRGRARRGITRRQLAQESGISERYLAQIEGGQGNPSVIVLRRSREAMEMPITDLLPASGQRDARSTASSNWSGGCRRRNGRASPRPLEQRIRGKRRSERAHRIALVGLRGAGKSTLGQHARQAARLSVRRAQSRGRAGIRRQHLDADRDVGRVARSAATNARRWKR